MADLVAIATGNFTAAATWGLVDTTSKLISTSTSTTALTTGNLDSANFTPGAVTIAGIVVRLTGRAAGAPTNTITCILRNTSGGVDTATVTANVSDLPASGSGTDSEGGWHYFRFNAPVLLVAATNYAVRLTLSSTSTAVNCGTNGVANNWQRLLVTSTTQAPAAGDDLWMAQLLSGATNPATVTALTITMNSTAATDYGTAVVSNYQPAVSVSKACTFAYALTAATNFLLRISGSLMVYSGGILNIGSSGSEIPRDSTGILEFDNASDGQFGIRVLNGGILNAHGLSRTSGKEIWMTRLSADEAVASTTIDVTDDTGWLNGDEVSITSTSRTASETEIRSLNANAGASSFTISAGLTNAHLGSGDYIAEIVLLTRNVEIRSVTAAQMCYHNFQPTSVVSCSWMRWRYYSSVSGGGLYTINTTTGSFSVVKSIYRDSDQGLNFAGNTGNWILDQVVIMTCASVGNCVVVNATTGTWTLTDVFFLSNTGNSLIFSDIGGTIGNLWFVSCTSAMVWAQSMNNANTNGPTFSGGPTWTFHSNGTGVAQRCLGFTASTQDITFPTLYMWRNNSDPIELDLGVSLFNVEFTGDFFGNGVAAAEEPSCFIAARQNCLGNVRFNSCNISGDNLFQANWGILLDGHNIAAAEMQWNDCVFSENTGTRRPLLVADIGLIPDIESGGMIMTGIADNCMFGAPESIKYFLSTGPAPHLAQKQSYVLCPRYNQSNTAHRMYGAYATFILDTTRENIKPIAGAALAVDSNGFRRNTGFLVAVNSAGTVTVDVDVEIDAGYNGSTDPQLVLLANKAAGINADVVLDTHSGAVGTENLSGTTAAVSADCVLEFVIRCYGTAGNAFVDNWNTAAAGEDTTGVRYWFGQPITNANTTGGGGGATPTSAAYIG